VPYILPIGLWALAVGSAFTFGQRVRAVYQAARDTAEHVESSAAQAAPD
jgi:hypothetical protein